MNPQDRPTGFDRQIPSSSPLRGSPLSILVASTVLLGFWHNGTSFAQYPNTVYQPVTVYHPIVGNSSAVTAASFTNAPEVGSYSSVPTVSSGVATGNWALDVANAQQNLDVNRLPDIVQTRKRLDQAMADLENFLATSPQHQSNWLAFLTWKDLQKELKEEIPDQDRILQFEKIFRQNYFGLEMRQFSNVRDALGHYSNALKFSSDKSKSIEILSNRLKKLNEQLQMPNVVQDFESTRDIGQTVALLTQGNQASSLISAIKSRYSRANARVLVSSEFVSRRFSRPVQEANPVNELILGTQIYGQSWLQGQVTPQLIDSSSHAALRLNLSGSFSSQNIGYNRSVKLHTQGSGNVAASETIALTDSGLVTLNDTASDASLSSQINDIEAKLRIVRRIASKQAAKQKPEADSIAEGRLENRIRLQFPREARTADQRSQSKDQNSRNSPH